MAEESKTPQQTEQPRYCPACGSRVAAMATTCLMCGASLTEEEAVPESAKEGGARQRLPGWARALIVVGLALLILSAGSFVFYKLLMTAEPEESEVLTPTASPTRTPTASPTRTPTQTATPIPTPTPIPPLVHEVQEGETLIDIASSYAVTVEDLQNLNPNLDPNLLQVGQVILIPAATPTPGPTSTLDPNIPTPTPPEYIVHIVSPGETLSTIAERYAEQYPQAGVSVQSIRIASDLPADDDTIRVNQSLIIPLGTPSPSPTPTTNPNATPTPVPHHSAVPLLSPHDGAVIVGNAKPILLQWASISILRDDEWYELTLSQPSSGAISVTAYTRATAWRVPVDLMPAADASVDVFQWQVQIVQETHDGDDELVYEVAGAPSEVRTFAWLMVTPTPSATPTPTSTFTPTSTSTSTPTLTPTSTLTGTMTSTVTSTLSPSPTLTLSPSSTPTP
jgi:LysM repeat protein